MGLLSFLKRQRQDTPSGPRDPSFSDPPSIDVVRTRARRRLIGAAILVVLAVVLFPIVFETSPRPVPVDLAIEIPRKDGAAPLPPLPVKPIAPAGQGARGDVVAEPPVSKPVDPNQADNAASAAKPADAPPKSAPADAKASAPAAAPHAEKAPEPAADRSTKPTASTSASEKPATPKPAIPTAPTATADAARAKALLEGKSAAPAAAPAMRFVVQVGAFADANAVKETRAKVEKLGVRTYTQSVDTGSGRRTRVRIGPFDGRDEAEKVASKLKAAGLTAAVLTL